MNKDLTELRGEIDGIDRRLIDLLEQRMDISAAIAAYKAAQGLPTLDAGREAEKLDAVRALCRAETAEPIADVMRAVMAASRAYQAALRGDRYAG